MIPLDLVCYTLMGVLALGPLGLAVSVWVGAGDLPADDVSGITSS